MIDPRLPRLRAELEQYGAVVVPHGEHICVRLPLAASVVVRVEGGALRCHPQLGPFGRSSTLAGTAAATTAGVGITLATGGLALPFLIAAGGVSALLVELGGVVLAEGALTRIQSAWARIIEEDGGRLAPARSEPRALEAPPPDELARIRRDAERHA